jgi:hypothetical protein
MERVTVILTVFACRGIRKIGNAAEPTSRKAVFIFGADPNGKHLLLSTRLRLTIFELKI